MRHHRFDIVITLACFALLGYFAWHAWKGPRGYPYRDRLAAETVTLQTQFSEIRSSHNALEQRVSLLRPDHVDADFLDELARDSLELANANELVATDNTISQVNP